MSDDLMVTLPAVPCDALVEILGRPNFACIRIAQVLRLMGRDIPKKSEHEQAHTILFVLRHWAADPVNWQENANAELRAAIDQHQPPATDA